MPQKRIVRRYVSYEMDAYIREFQQNLKKVGVDISQEDVTRMLPVIFDFLNHSRRIAIIIKRTGNKNGGEKPDKMDDYFSVPELSL
jgi:hypothetical protein